MLKDNVQWLGNFGDGLIARETTGGLGEEFLRVGKSEDLSGENID